MLLNVSKLTIYGFIALCYLNSCNYNMSSAEIEKRIISSSLSHLVQVFEDHKSIDDFSYSLEDNSTYIGFDTTYFKTLIESEIDEKITFNSDHVINYNYLNLSNNDFIGSRLKLTSRRIRNWRELDKSANEIVLRTSNITKSKSGKYIIIVQSICSGHCGETLVLIWKFQNDWPVLVKEVITSIQ